MTPRDRHELETTFRGIRECLGRVPTLDQVKAEADVTCQTADEWWAGHFEAGSSDPT